MWNLFSDKFFKECDRVGKTTTTNYTPCNLVLKPLLELLKLNQMLEKIKWPRSSASEDNLQCLFGNWLDLSDLSTDREPKARNSNIQLPSGLVYLLLCFLSKVSTHHLLRLFNLLLWRSIVTCNRCNIVSSHKCLTYTNQTFCTMSFNRKLIKFFGGIFRKWEAMFVLIFAWTLRGF